MTKLTQNNGRDLTENEIKNILKKYFTEESIPSNLLEGDPELVTIDGGYKVNLSEVLNGITMETGE